MTEKDILITAISKKYNIHGYYVSVLDTAREVQKRHNLSQRF